MNLLKEQLLYWSSQYKYACFLTGNEIPVAFSEYEVLVAVSNQHQGFSLGDISRSPYSDNWFFGYIAYEYCHSLFGIEDEEQPRITFDNNFFFIPEILVVLKKGQLYFLKGENVEIQRQIEQTVIPSKIQVPSIEVFTKFSKSSYLEKVRALQNHIHRGDVYEINFCQEFFSKDVENQAVNYFNALNKFSPMPFAAFFKQGDKYALCASPERFIAKRNSQLISQPIKGTAKRNLKSEEQDSFIKQTLEQSVKERAENVMIVDLVRNDFTKIAVPTTVEVSELLKVHSFKQVHQMMSTIVCRVEKDTKLADIIQATFPMGSMTGAPKKRAMELIRQYEEKPRGLFSGAIGYLSPNNDFDFNVVIRTILYDAETKTLSFHTGSAITFLSNPEEEYEECMLKAKAILTILDNRTLDSK